MNSHDASQHTSAIPDRAPKKRPKHARTTTSAYQTARLARQFLEDNEVLRNTVTQEEFSRFMPLFNKSLFDSLDAEAKSNLAYDFNQRFNPMEPISIIDPNKLDPNGAIWSVDKEKHLVIFKLPASRPKLKTVNDLGEQAVQVASEMMAAAAKSAGPFDDRAKKYSKALADLIDKANEDSLKEQDKEFKETVEELRSKVSTQNNPPFKKTNLLRPEVPEKSKEPEGVDVDWDD